MSKVVFCDPPSGWKYGFPKMLPKTFSTADEFNSWLVAEGYPELEIQYWKGRVPYRCWEQELDNGDKTFNT